MPGPVELVGGKARVLGETGDPELVRLAQPKPAGLHRAGWMRPALQDQTWMRAIEGSRTPAHSLPLCQPKALSVSC